MKCHSRWENTLSFLIGQDIVQRFVGSKTHSHRPQFWSSLHQMGDPHIWKISLDNRILLHHNTFIIIKIFICHYNRLIKIVITHYVSSVNIFLHQFIGPYIYVKVFRKYDNFSQFLSGNVCNGYQYQVNMGSGNGLVQSGNKPLPEPLLTNSMTPYGIARGLGLKEVDYDLLTSVK